MSQAFRIDFEFAGGTTYHVHVQGKIPAVFVQEFTKLKRINFIQTETDPTEKRMASFNVDSQST